MASLQADPWKIVSFSLYGATLVLLYGVSPLYHSVRGRAKAWLQKCDHSAIYLLIAGSYTPFSLVTLRGPGAGACSASAGAWPCSASCRN
jgi:hemolysin III